MSLEPLKAFHLRRCFFGSNTSPIGGPGCLGMIILIPDSQNELTTVTTVTDNDIWETGRCDNTNNTVDCTLYTNIIYPTPIPLENPNHNPI